MRNWSDEISEVRVLVPTVPVAKRTGPGQGPFVHIQTGISNDVILSARLCSTQFFSDWLDSDSFDNPDDSTLTQLIWVRVEPKVLTQILLMIYHSLFNVVKSSWPGGEGAAGCIFVGRFSLQRYSNMQKIRSFSVELVTQLWLEQLSVESTLAQVTVSVTQLWLDSAS